MHLTLPLAGGVANRLGWDGRQARSNGICALATKIKNEERKLEKDKTTGGWGWRAICN